MLVQNISMKYLQDLGTASVPYLFRGLIYVGIQYDHKCDDCGGKVDLAWRARWIEVGEIITKFDIPGHNANIFKFTSWQEHLISNTGNTEEIDIRYIGWQFLLF